MKLLQDSREQGETIICNVVYAELAYGFENRGYLDGALDRLELTVTPVCYEAAHEAGRRRSRYRKAGGPTKPDPPGISAGFSDRCPRSFDGRFVSNAGQRVLSDLLSRTE